MIWLVTSTPQASSATIRYRLLMSKASRDCRGVMLGSSTVGTSAGPGGGATPETSGRGVSSPSPPPLVPSAPNNPFTVQ